MFKKFIFLSLSFGMIGNATSANYFNTIKEYKDSIISTSVFSLSLVTVHLFDKSIISKFRQQKGFFVSQPKEISFAYKAIFSLAVGVASYVYLKLKNNSNNDNFDPYGTPASQRPQYTDQFPANAQKKEVLNNKETENSELDDTVKNLVNTHKNTWKWGFNPIMGAIHDHKTTTALNIINEPKYADFINQATSDGLTALHMAAEEGFVEVVEALLDKRAVIDANVKSGTLFGATPLYCAIRHQQQEVVNLLIERGATYKNRSVGCQSYAKLAEQYGIKLPQQKN